MSRYIRTKDGEIFDTEVNGAWETNDGTIGIPTINGIVVTPKAFIVKEADTIEELCDEFVMVNNADKQPFRISVKVINEMRNNDDDRCVYSGSSEYAFNLAKEKLEKVKEFCGTKENHDEYANYLYEENPDFKFTISLYGAIWTDKGLIYVAQMNEKGELELL